MAFVVGDTQSAAGAGTDATVNKPTGTTTGNLLVAHYGVNETIANAGTITVPSGWTQIRYVGGANAPSMGVWAKIATSSEPSTYTFSNANGVGTTLSITVISGNSTILPTISSEQHNNVASTTATGATITPTVANSLILFFVNNGNTGFSAYAVATDNPSWTEAYDVDYAGAPDAALAYAVRPQTTATGNATATCVSGRNNVIMLAIDPIPEATITDTIVTTDTHTAYRLLVVLASDTIAVIESIVSTAERIWTNVSKSITSWTNRNKS